MFALLAACAAAPAADSAVTVAPTENAAPPALVVSTGACPFEGCRLGRWTAREAVAVYDAIDGRVVRTLRPAETVEARYGEIHAVPRPALVEATYASDEAAGIRAGDVVYVLHPAGEGALVVWTGGRIVEGSLDLRLRLDDPMQPLAWTWWVQLRFDDGSTGWVKDPLHRFDGMDALAG